MHRKLVVAALVLIAACALAAAAFFLPAQQVSPVQPAGHGTALVLYYGDGCPHCANVEAFIKKNEAVAALPIERKEVYHDRANATELAGRAASCGLPSDSIGVPFLWDGAQCYVGDAPVISYLSQRAGLGEQKSAPEN